MQDPFKLGEKLRQFRVHFNFTQEYVAATLHVPKSTYCEYEKGGSPVPNHLVLRAAALFQVSPEVFFTTAPLELGTKRTDVGTAHVPNVPQDMMGAFLRATDELEEKLFEFMKAQASTMNEQAAMIARLLRGGLNEHLWSPR